MQSEHLLTYFRSYGLDRALAYYAGLVSSSIPEAIGFICFLYTRDGETYSSLSACGLGQDFCSPHNLIDMEITPTYPRPGPDKEIATPVLILPHGAAHPGEDEPVAYGSVARLPIYRGERFSLFLAVFSHAGTRLSQAQMDYCMQLAAPLGGMLAEELRLRNTTRTDAMAGMPAALAGIERCPGLQALMPKVHSAARENCTVLISGETGTGKEMVAEAIQELSDRAQQPFIRVNCGGLPDGLVDSLFFGHEKGAFTGAYAQQLGYFEQAQKGTLFLDEVGELSLHAQSRLLRVLDRWEIQHVGGMRTIPLDIRVIAATNRDLAAMVAEGQFREDLWYRLTVYPIHLPPLRARKIDIAPLARYFLETKAKARGLSSISSLTNEDFQTLYAHSWTGNVRELAMVIERALIDASVPDGKGGRMAGKLTLHIHEALQTHHTDTTDWPSLDTFTTRYIQQALHQCHGKIFGSNGAAALLGLNPHTLRNKVLKMNPEGKN